MQFAGAALPIIIGIIWLFGVFAIVALAAIVSGGIWWFKRNRQRRD
jgi:fatty acid desaturase